MTPLLPLPPGQVDVWAAFVADAFDGNAPRPHPAVLNAAEWAQHDRFVFDKDRRRYRVTRLLVRHVLSRYVDLAPADWVFEPTPFGRPAIANHHPGVADLVFNITHSDTLVLLGVTRGAALGIDVEDLARRAPLDVAHGFFAAAELRQLQALPAAAQPRRFFEFWTLKESYIKAHGKGLSLPLDQFAFDLQTEGRLGLAIAPALADRPERWAVRQWQPSADSLAALCVQATGVPLHLSARRVRPFEHEEPMPLDVLRSTAA